MGLPDAEPLTAFPGFVVMWLPELFVFLAKHMATRRLRYQNIALPEDCATKRVAVQSRSDATEKVATQSV